MDLQILKFSTAKEFCNTNKNKKPQILFRLLESKRGTVVAKSEGLMPCLEGGKGREEKGFRAMK